MEFLILFARRVFDRILQLVNNHFVAEKHEHIMRSFFLHCLMSVKFKEVPIKYLFDKPWKKARQLGYSIEDLLYYPEERPIHPLFHAQKFTSKANIMSVREKFVIHSMKAK